MRAVLNPKALTAVNTFQLCWYYGQQIADRKKTLRLIQASVDTAIDQ